MTAAVAAAKIWFDGQNIPADHGLEHALAVLAHAKRALKHTNLSKRRATRVLIAALLHDVDDRKVTGLPRGVKNTYSNARTLCVVVGLPERDIAKIVEMISLVAASENGNSVVAKLYKLIPRECDRIEALGMIGVERCAEYTKRIGRPEYTPATPMPTTPEELDVVLAGYNIENYSGTSASMLDHFYDKLLHLGVSHTGNEYVIAEMNARVNIMRDWLLERNREICASTSA